MSECLACGCSGSPDDKLYPLGPKGEPLHRECWLRSDLDYPPVVWPAIKRWLAAPLRYFRPRPAKIKGT